MKNINYKKGFYIILVTSLLIIITLSTVIYLNIDYIIFKNFITSRYLYPETFNEMITNELQIDSKSNYYKYFDNLAIEQLSKLISFTAKDPYTYQFTPREYTNYVSWRQEKASVSHTEEISKDTLYVLFANFTPASYDFLYNNISLINNYDNLIFDLRGNGGGDLDVLFDICGLFVGNEKVITIEKTRTYEKSIKSTQIQKIFVKNIVILIDEHSASASESLTICLKELYPNTTTVGKTTYGKGIGQTRINLTKGFYSKATTLEWLSPKGVSINKVGITPDYPYEGETFIEYVINMILK